MITTGESVEAWQRRYEQGENLACTTLRLGKHRHELKLPADGSLDDSTRQYLLQRASSFRWIIGPGQLQLENHPLGQQLLDEAFSNNGSHAFEAKFFAGREVQTTRATQEELGTGPYSLFFDIGGSSLKGALFHHDQLQNQYSLQWNPFLYKSMEELLSTLTKFLKELTREHNHSTISHVGISCAGLCQNGALLASSLTQGITFSTDSAYNPWFLRDLVQRLFPQSSLQLLNDGAVTALPQQQNATLAEKNIISLVMGSNLGGGYYSTTPQLSGIHELGFLPVLLDDHHIDEWSGYSGIGSTIFSKQGLFWLAEQAGYQNSSGLSERQFVHQIHKDLKQGLPKALHIFHEMAKVLAPFIAYLQRFYTIDELLLSGGILSESVIDEMRAPYQQAYKELCQHEAPPLRMLVVPDVLPEYNQVWSLALHHFSKQK